MVLITVLEHTRADPRLSSAARRRARALL